jgi:hypothetical protein
MSGQMWMGTRGYERWVKAPLTGNLDFSRVGWQAKSQYLNGGASVRSSFASHKEYVMAWRGTRHEMRLITDLATGMFGAGPIFFIDPVAADKNVLPLQWSYPALAAKDGPILLGTTRPSTIPTPSNVLGYPIDSVQYPTTGTSKSIYIPIPPGFTAWFGFAGTSNGTGGVRVTPILPGNTATTPVLPTILAVTDPTRMNTSFAGGTYQGIVLDWAVGTATSVTVAGMMVQILPTGTLPNTAPGSTFHSGQGHSGCKFESMPTMTPYSVPADSVGVAARLVEIGDWI